MMTLATFALALSIILFSIDHYLNDAGVQNPFVHYWNFDAEAVSNSIGVMSSIIAAVLGIVVTVVSIVVQLAATRYSPAVTEMFLRDRTNLFVISIYVVGCVMGFWISFGVNVNWVPRVSLITMLITSTMGFVLMIPYFAYVFRFLDPQNVVVRITLDAQQAAINATPNRTAIGISARHAAVLRGAERLSDIAINSISQKDKIIATSCADALRDLVVAYINKHDQLDKEWFALSGVVRTNLDFASMAEDSLRDLEQQGTWFEFKVLRQYQAIYAEALGTMRDINYVIAINTRHIVKEALRKDNQRALDLAIKFFNTFIRATINENDVRTAYTILNQYRMIGEALLRDGRNLDALRIAGHMRYYARVGFQKRLAFVTETIAYDMGTLCEIAHEIGAKIEQDLLGLFLSVDPTSAKHEVQETSLRGIRKAQIKLATYYLTKGSADLARQIWRDMEKEPRERLQSIQDELAAVETKDFWEISDRGGNFDYLDADRKHKLDEFFDWFQDATNGVTNEA